jgi:hypothetical protein
MVFLRWFNSKKVRHVPDLLIENGLYTLIAVFGRVAGTSLVEIIVGFDIRGKVNCFTSGKLPCGFKDDHLALMVCAFEMTAETNLVDILTAFGCICSGNFILGVDGRKRAFRHARAAINAGVGVNVHPGPLGYGLARDNTLHGTYFNTTTVTNA